MRDYGIIFLNESTIQASDALMSAIEQIHNKRKTPTRKLAFFIPQSN